MTEAGLGNEEQYEEYELRQVDLMREVDHIPIRGDGGEVEMISCPNGVAVISQCCDLARTGKGNVHVAPICVLDPATARDARSGRTSRYIPIPESDGEFVDLGTVGSLRPTFARSQKVVAGVPGDGSRNAVRQRVGRRYSRFAFHDSIVPVLGVLQKRVRDRASNTDSNFGRALEMVAALRVKSAQGWDAPSPWDLTVIVVVEAGYLGTEIVAKKPDIVPTIDAASARVIRADVGTQEMVDAWEDLRLAMQANMEKKGYPKELTSIEVEVTDEDDFTFRQFRQSVSLDLDDLSNYLDG